MHKFNIFNAFAPWRENRVIGEHNAPPLGPLMGEEKEADRKLREDMKKGMEARKNSDKALFEALGLEYDEKKYNKNNFEKLCAIASAYSEPAKEQTGDQQSLLAEFTKQGNDVSRKALEAKTLQDKDKILAAFNAITDFHNNFYQNLTAKKTETPEKGTPAKKGGKETLESRLSRFFENPEEQKKYVDIVKIALLPQENESPEKITDKMKALRDFINSHNSYDGDYKKWNADLCGFIKVDAKEPAEQNKYAAALQIVLGEHFFNRSKDVFEVGKGRKANPFVYNDGMIGGYTVNVMAVFWRDLYGDKVEHKDWAKQAGLSENFGNKGKGGKQNKVVFEEALNSLWDKVKIKPAGQPVAKTEEGDEALKPLHLDHVRYYAAYTEFLKGKFSKDVIGPGKLVNPDSNRFKNAFDKCVVWLRDPANILYKDSDPNSFTFEQWQEVASRVNVKDIVAPDELPQHLKTEEESQEPSAGAKEGTAEAEEMPEFDVKVDLPKSPETKGVEALINTYYDKTLYRNYGNLFNNEKVDAGAFVEDYLSTATEPVQNAYRAFVKAKTARDDAFTELNTLKANPLKGTDSKAKAQQKLEKARDAHVATLKVLYEAIGNQRLQSKSNLKQWVTDHSLPPGITLESLDSTTYYNQLPPGFGDQKFLDVLKDPNRAKAFASFYDLVSNAKRTDLEALTNEMASKTPRVLPQDPKESAASILKFFNAAIYLRNVNEYTALKKNWFLETAPATVS